MKQQQIGFRRWVEGRGGSGIPNVTAPGTSSLYLPPRQPRTECGESERVWLGLSLPSWNRERPGVGGRRVMVDTWVKYASWNGLIACGMLDNVYM